MTKAAKIVGVSLGAALAAAAGFGAPYMLANKDFDVANAPKDIKELCGRGINSPIPKLSLSWIDKDCATKFSNAAGKLGTSSLPASGIAIPAICTDLTDACIRQETKRHQENSPQADMRPTNIKCSVKVVDGAFRITQCAPLAP